MSFKVMDLDFKTLGRENNMVLTAGGWGYCAHSHIWDDHIRMSDLSDLIQNEYLELFSSIPASMDWNYSFDYSIYKVFIHKSTC